MFAPYVPYATWEQVLRHIQFSIKSEQVFCSIVTQMGFLPQFSNDVALKTVHKENYETSYHRNTAAGNLERLLYCEETDETLVLMTVECFIEARAHDKKAGNALREIQTSDVEDENWVDAATRWHKLRKLHLKAATRILYDAIGPDIWQKGAALAE